LTGLKRLIFNADDFGLTDGVCTGVAEAIAGGAVKSTTAMVCTPPAKSVSLIGDRSSTARSDFTCSLPAANRASTRRMSVPW
jgi:hypothetical protein